MKVKMQLVSAEERVRKGSGDIAHDVKLFLMEDGDPEVFQFDFVRGLDLGWYLKDANGIVMVARKDAVEVEVDFAIVTKASRVQDFAVMNHEIRVRGIRPVGTVKPGAVMAESPASTKKAS